MFNVLIFVKHRCDFQCLTKQETLRRTFTDRRVFKLNPTLMSRSNDEPQWLRSARAAWPNGSAPRGLDPKWSPHWIKKLLGYLERQGGMM